MTALDDWNRIPYPARRKLLSVLGSETVRRIVRDRVVSRRGVWSEGGVRGRGLVLGLGRGWGFGVVHAVAVTLARAREI
jgi:hypothetical protein